MHNNIAKKCSKSLIIPTGKPLIIQPSNFSRYYPFVKSGLLLKLTEWWIIIQAAVTHGNLKKSTQVSLKYHLEFLAMPTNTTTDAMTLKFFQILCLTVWKIYESDQNSEQSFE